MFQTFFGLPLHPLVVHATVVVLPTAAVTVLAAALSPRFRAWAGPLPLVLAALSVILVPVSTSSGESLEEKVPDSSLVSKHADVAEALLPWVIGLAVVAALSWYVGRRAAGPVEEPSPWATAAVMVASLVAATGTIVEVGLIGHSGAKAAWSDVEQPPPVSNSSNR